MYEIISHRGNLEGPRPEHENNPDYLDEAIQETEVDKVEADFWWVDGGLWLGHDYPKYRVSDSWVSQRSLWILGHAKNSPALAYIIKNFPMEVFWHESDQYTLTSLRRIIVHPGLVVPSFYSSIMIKPELYGDSAIFAKPIQNSAICTDFPKKWKRALDKPKLSEVRGNMG